MKIDRNRSTVVDGPEQIVQRMIIWEPPALPGTEGERVARFRHTATWTPPGTRTLVRHRAPDGRRVVTADRTPPPGFEIEFDLGVGHTHGLPGTHRLIAKPDGFLKTTVEGEVREPYRDLGYVESHALPMLDALEVRRVPETGQETLVCGAADPLFSVAEHVATVGFIDSYPIQPREPHDVRTRRTVKPLYRRVETTQGRHRYERGEPGGSDAVLLATLRGDTAPGFIALSADGSGRVTSALMERGAKLGGPVASARWALAPLNWSERRVPHLWSVRAAAGRMRKLPETLRNRRGRDDRATEVLGYVRAEPAPGWTPLFSATHAIVGDQFLTLSELEARDLGYVIDGVLGYVSLRGAGERLVGPESEIKWASRFGQRRRYVIGPA